MSNTPRSRFFSHERFNRAVPATIWLYAKRNATVTSSVCREYPIAREHTASIPSRRLHGFLHLRVTKTALSAASLLNSISIHRTLEVYYNSLGRTSFAKYPEASILLMTHTSPFFLLSSLWSTASGVCIRTAFGPVREGKMADLI